MQLLSGLIKASEIDEGSLITLTDGNEVYVVKNKFGDVLWLFNDTGEYEELFSVHLFYEDKRDIEFAEVLGIDLTL